MITTILGALWFFLPAAVANMAPMFAKRLPFIRRYYHITIDGGRSWRGKRLLGDNKTVLGVVAGVVAGAGTGLLQAWLTSKSEWVQSFSFIDYTNVQPLLFGAALGFGALLGDTIESFFKRQLNRPSGSAWVPFDQLDYVVGGLLIGLSLTPLNAEQAFVTFIIWVLLHPAATFIGWLIGWKDSPI